MEHDTRKGFTIVELLIVVVVIAILAAITIVSYNGIQARATNSQALSAVNSYVKAFHTYYRTHGDTVPSNFHPACFDNTICWSGVTETNNTALRNGLLEGVSSVPSMPKSYANVLANGSTGDSSTGGTYTGYYILYQHADLTGACEPVSGTRYLNGTTASGVRTCRAAIEL